MPVLVPSVIHTGKLRPRGEKPISLGTTASLFVE